MPAVLLGVALVVVVLLLGRGFLALEPRELARILRWTGGLAAVAVMLLLLASGQEGLLVVLTLLAAGALAFRRGRGRQAAAGAPPSGQTSRLETRLLRMTLDHDSGRLDGEVISGRFQGRRLEELGFDELMQLLGDCRATDPEAVTVLETWLDRTLGADWRRRAEAAGPAGGGGAASGGPMSREEALAILGLDAGASSEAVREAHRRLMARLHPDHGGSTWLAAKLNLARDLLLKGRE